MAKGHTISLIDLTKSLLHLGLKVTFITTPSNQPFILSSLPTTSPLLHIITLPFPTSPSLPTPCESTDYLPSPDLYPTFLNLTKNLSRPFHALLQNLSSSAQLPLCVISDFFIGWTLDSCRAFGVPRLVSHGMSVFSMSICKSLWAHGSARPNDLRFTIADLPQTIRCVDPDKPVVRFVGETGEADVQSWGVIVNSFDGLDGDYAGLFESFYRAGSRAWFVGPLLFGCSGGGGDESGPDVARVIEWLDRRADGSVMYVSFGTQAHVSDTQLDEIAHGLELSGWDFVWAVRSASWAVPDLSHCGWNSVLESVSAGVPMLAWPMIAEQPLNAKFVVDELRAGLRIPLGQPGDSGFIVEPAVIAKRVKELMGGEKGGIVRIRARKRAVQPGGSSNFSLSGLIDELRRGLDGSDESVWVTQHGWTQSTTTITL
ncbi:UDP-glycosyltransferase 73B4 [Acorus gramineus]|uniref:UDP-glycosyltransferase 73B4 n=1 Tax=Acorus gramineus TaxID=55184 RepID=A0AAV9BF29_ACOGR|nr:UDP-glycosyltransferase 73B4 [Acorus gramineus]